jgi:hypothetical protein
MAGDPGPHGRGCWVLDAILSGFVEKPRRDEKALMNNRVDE